MDELFVLARYFAEGVPALQFQLNTNGTPHPQACVTAAVTDHAQLPSIIVRSDCSYADRMWRTSLSSRSDRWRIVHSSDETCHAAVSLDEYEVIDWSRVLGPPYMVASSFCMRKGLGRKGNMASSLEAHAKRCKAAGGCPLRTALPETVTVDSTPVFISRPPMVDFHSAMAECLFEAEEAMANPSTVAAVGPGSGAGAAPSHAAEGDAWILKPSLTNKGAGIEIVRTIDEVAMYVRELPEVGQWVLQRYIPRPLLLLGPQAGKGRTGHKFHLRVYVLAVGALTVYVYHQALVLIAVQPYDAVDLGNRTAHITNTCVGVEDDGFHEETHVRAMSELPQLLVECGNCTSMETATRVVDRVYSDIRRIVAHSFAGQETSAGGYMPLPRCFELYGVDFIVDDDLNTWLLEFNPSPDIKQTGGRLGYIIEGMVEGTVQVALDRRVRAKAEGSTKDVCGQHGRRDDAQLIDVDVEPAMPAPNSGLTVNEGGFVEPSSGPQGVVSPSSVPARDASGWDMVYTKKWRQAHGEGRMTVS